MMSIKRPQAENNKLKFGLNRITNMSVTLLCWSIHCGLLSAANGHNFVTHILILFSNQHCIHQEKGFSV